jgi:hypothetical protein
VFLDQRFGFGRYEFRLLGRPDQFDDNVVLGLFNYTVPEVGPDGTNEIDIEFATWGGAQTSTATTRCGRRSRARGGHASLRRDARGRQSLHRFDWASAAWGSSRTTGWTPSERAHPAVGLRAALAAAAGAAAADPGAHELLAVPGEVAGPTARIAGDRIVDFRYVEAPMLRTTGFRE